jgi:hypothetical protein
VFDEEDGMTAIMQIRVQLNTGTPSGAGTNGDVYLGICGREFHLDTSADDFERSAKRCTSWARARIR